MRKTKWRPGGRRKRPRNRRVMRKATEGGQEQKRVPPANCQTLVMKDGTIRSEAALAGAMTRLSKPIETVGSPSPITPLTKPASRKVRVATMRGRCSTDMRQRVRQNRRFGEVVDNFHCDCGKIPLN